VTIGPGRLPRRTLRAGTCLYRIHRAVNSPWFFSSGSVRFDPAGVDGRGASYWAADGLGAWVETFRTRMLLAEREIVERRLSVATLEEDAVVCVGERLIGIAWFGNTEARPSGHASLPPTTTAAIPEEVVSGACRIFGYQVLPNPPS